MQAVRVTRSRCISFAAVAALLLFVSNLAIVPVARPVDRIVIRPSSHSTSVVMGTSVEATAPETSITHDTQLETAVSTDRAQPKILYYNTHAGTKANMEFIMSHLKLNFSQFNPDSVEGSWEMSYTRAKELVDGGFAKTICLNYDIVIIADTFVHGRALVSSILAHEEKQCGATIVAELTNRFDWGLEHNRGTWDSIQFHQVIWQINQHEDLRNRIIWTENNPLESRHLSDCTYVNPEFRLMRPVGYSPVKPQEISDEDQNKVVFCPADGMTPSPLLYILDKLQVPHKVLPKHYGGPHTLAKYRAYIEIPYQVSTMKIYENIAAGVVMLFPSQKFMAELVLKDIMFFYPALTMFRTGKDEPEWEGFMDYYHPDLSPYFYYFDSWEHLKQIILSPNPIDTKNVRVEGPKFYDRVRDKTLRGWADLIGSLGFSIPFNGKVAPFPPDLIDAPYRPRLPDVKVPRPSDMEDVFPRVREWRLNEEERFRQIRKVQYMRLTHLELSALQYRKWMQEKIPDGMLVDFPKEHDGMDSLLFHLNEVIDGLMRSGSDAKQSMGVFDATTVEWARNATASVKKYEKISPQGYRTFAQMARIARFSHSALQFVSSSKDQKLLAMKAPLKESLKTSVRIAYPWLLSKMYKTMDDLTGSFSGRGIVFVIEDDGYDRVLQTIAHLRKNLACDLPIEVFYNGDYHHDDPNGSFQRGDIRLKEQRRLDLASISNVTTRDIHHAYDKFWEQSGTTEHARSFAIVASKFAEAIVIHEDTVLLQNPDTIVSDSERFKSDGVYMQQGPLSDESGHSQWVSWFLGGEKFVSEASKSGRYFRNVTRHEMNAGFMAFDKKRVSVLHGLLVASFLNSEDARKENFDWFLDTTKGKGEQETYWIGMELAQAPYKFVNNAVGLVAQASTNSEVCGPIVYLDENGAPIRLQSKAWDFSKLSEVDMVYQLQEDDTKVAVSERNGLFCLNGSKGTGRVSPIGVNGTLGFEETVAAAKGMLKIANVRKSKNLKKFFQS